MQRKATEICAARQRGWLESSLAARGGKDCKRTTAAGGTVQHVKAVMTGVMLIVVRVVRFALEPVREILQSTTNDSRHYAAATKNRCQHKLTKASLHVLKG